MKHEAIKKADLSLIDSVARSCGEVTVSCADVAGLVENVMSTSKEMAGKREALHDVVTKLASDQKQVADSTDEARLLAERAKDQLLDGTSVIADSMSEFGNLTDLVVTLGERVTGFAAAMEQVRRVSLAIDTIARTTNMLALNAAIEAEKAGEAGATFAVVAAEVKKLAHDTRAATDEISTTMDSLGVEANSFVEQIQTGVEKSKDAQQNFKKIDETISGVSNIFTLVGQQNEDIAQSTNMIHNNVQKVQEVLDHFSVSAEKNETDLDAAKKRVTKLEILSNGMFDQIVHSGFAVEDGEYVEIAKSGHAEVVKCVEDALASGQLTIDELYDFGYQEIEGSSPKRYNNSFNDFADRNIRPILDKYGKGIRSEILGSVCTTQHGYLPTHSTEMSQAPTNDPTHNDNHCRHRRILLDDVTQRAIDSRDSDYIAAVYRLDDLRGEEIQVTKNVFVPLYFNGRYWGNFELAYFN